jgi:hypothetical protein
MRYVVNDPRHWHERAKGTPILAERLTDAMARNNTFEVAAAYERMADRAEHHPTKSPVKPKDVA